jgi:hypothetical protein
MRAPARSCAAFALALVLVTSPAHAQDSQAPDPTRHARATLEPGVARLGERVLYRGEVVARSGESIQFMPPEPDSVFTWGTPRVGRRASASPGQKRPPGPSRGLDTLWIEIPLQVFEIGVHTIPGVRVVQRASPSDPPALLMRLPDVRLPVIPVMTAADSNSKLREVHGPLAAPWWERVPWLWVILGLLIAAAIVWLVRKLRKRKPVAVPAPVAKPAARRDPVAEALGDLRALKARRLPEAGEFSEHAFVLGRILRRYLEATVAITRPGDTTPELIEHLKLSSLADGEVQRLSGLLRVWDRIKFARDPFTAEEAHRAEDSVEAFIQASSAPKREVA